MSGPPRCAICDELADVDVSVHESCLSMLSRMASPEPTPGLRDRLENDIRELRGTGPQELAERLLRRGWTLASPTPEPTPGLREALVDAMEAHEDGRRGGAYPHLGQTNDIRRFVDWIVDWMEKFTPAALAASPAPEPTGLDAALAEDGRKWRAAEAEGHIADFTATGFGLQHPPSCRPDLIGCEFNAYLAGLDGPDEEPGRYRMTLVSDGTVEYTRLAEPGS